jgi:hypothetical protein
MSEITIRFHPKLADRFLSDGNAGPQAVASLARQAVRVVQGCGRRITYAPLMLPEGAGCAMSCRGGSRGAIIEIDGPGTAIAGGGVVIDRSLDRKDPRKRCKRTPGTVHSVGLKFQGMSASMFLLGHRSAIRSRVCWAQA